VSDYAYEGTRRVVYEDAVFIPICKTCGRFVVADEEIKVNGLGQVIHEPNATCSKCGRVEMPFEGWGYEGGENEI